MKDKSSRQAKKGDKGKTCCGYFSIKMGFILYGVFDVLVTIGLFSAIIAITVAKTKVKPIWYSSLAL